MTTGVTPQKKTELYTLYVQPTSSNHAPLGTSFRSILHVARPRLTFQQLKFKPCHRDVSLEERIVAGITKHYKGLNIEHLNWYSDILMYVFWCLKFLHLVDTLTASRAPRMTQYPGTSTADPFGTKLRFTPSTRGASASRNPHNRSG